MNETLKKIKQRGYWQVLIRPGEFVEKRIDPIGQCKTIVRDSVVRLRGWDYPYYDPREQPKTFTDYVEQTCDWKFFIELWRFYQSGQFIHFLAMREDWLAENPFGTPAGYEPGQALWFENTVHTFTEIYEFAARLAAKSVLGEQCSISVTLNGTNGREIVTGSPGRLLYRNYTSTLDKIESVIVKPTTELIAQSAELAREQAAYVFQRFNWDHITAQALKQDQDELLQGKR